MVCVGLPDGYENEGEDRVDLALPPGHDRLVEALAAVHDRVVVVLATGAPVTLPWVDDVAAVVAGHLAGQAGGGGLADVLTGRVAPAGRLAETWPRALADTPSAPWFPGGPSTVEYREHVYVGYRYHDTVDGDVQFPFGHGLGYAPTRWGDPSAAPARVDDAALRDGATVAVTVSVTNDGDVATREVVQVYVRAPGAAVHRPDRELGGFAGVDLAPGETAEVTVTLDRRALAHWDVEAGDWLVEPGTVELLVGRVVAGPAGRGRARGRCADAPGLARCPTRTGTRRYRCGSTAPRSRPSSAAPCRPTRASTGRGPATPRSGRRPAARSAGSSCPPWPVDCDAPSATTWPARALVRSMVEEAPLRTLLMGGITLEQLDLLVDLLNGRWGRGARRLVRRVAAAVAGR